MPADLPPLPPRPPDGHKGTFGTVCVVGGRADEQRVMAGGPALAALGALRSGCGLAVLAVPAPIMAAALVIAPSATGLSLPVDEYGAIRPSDVAQIIDRYLPGFRCLVIGPGLGDGEPQQKVLVRLIGQGDVPLVIDADGLNALAAVREFSRDFRSQAVLTPHPGEYRRLGTALGITTDPVDPSQRPAAAEQLARRLGCVVVLKGPGTIITDGVNTFTNDTGNVALGTAGTGDVLSGIIGGLIAQFFKPSLGSGEQPVTAREQGGLSLLDCARIGVYLHGLAADRWAARHGHAGLLAHELLDEIPDALRSLSKDDRA